MENVPIKKADVSTYFFGINFLIQLFVAACWTWSADKWVSGFLLKFEMTSLWFLVATAGIVFLISFYRGKMTKEKLDSFLILTTFCLIVYAGVLAKLAGLAKACSVK